MANEIPSSPPALGVDVCQYKYIRDGVHIGDMYVDIKGPIAFHCFRRDELTPWHGVCHMLSEIRQVKIDFDPDATAQGFRAYTWTYVFLNYSHLSTTGSYGIDGDGRPIRIERRCEWSRQLDGSYQRLADDLEWIQALIDRISPGTPG